MFEISIYYEYFMKFLQISYEYVKNVFYFDGVPSIMMAVRTLDKTILTTCKNMVGINGENKERIDFGECYQSPEKNNKINGNK